MACYLLNASLKDHKRLETILAFLAWLDKNQRISAVYRGHADKDWPITPSAFRDKAAGITTGLQLHRWQTAASRFTNPMPRGKVEWLVLAQHYGVPTPLVDWTTNPLTALFFAVTEDRSNTDACVIQCDKSAFKLLNVPDSAGLFKGTRMMPALLDTNSMNARTIAQDSMMSLHGKFTSPFVPMPHLSESFEILSSQKSDTRIALKRFGFTPERLYSDLATVVQEFKVGLGYDKLLGLPVSDDEFFARDADEDEDFPKPNIKIAERLPSMKKRTFGSDY